MKRTNLQRHRTGTKFPDLEISKSNPLSTNQLPHHDVTHICSHWKQQRKSNHKLWQCKKM